VHGRVEFVFVLLDGKWIKLLNLIQSFIPYPCLEHLKRLQRTVGPFTGVLFCLFFFQNFCKIFILFCSGFVLIINISEKSAAIFPLPFYYCLLYCGAISECQVLWLPAAVIGTRLLSCTYYIT